MAEQQVIELAVEGMSCNHCAASVKNTMEAIPGVEGVDVDLEKARVTIRGNDLDASMLAREIDALGFTAEVRS